MDLNVEAFNAEELLVLVEFELAADAARSLLNHTTYAVDSAVARERASAVLLQALFELGRFEEALPELTYFLGNPICWSTATLLLWVALALDSDQSEVALAVIEDCIQGWSKPNAGSTADHSQEKLTKLYQLLIIQVMPKAGKPKSEIISWLDKHAAQLPHEQPVALHLLLDGGSGLHADVSPPSTAVRQPSHGNTNASVPASSYTMAENPSGGHHRHSTTTTPSNLQNQHASSSMPQLHPSGGSDAAVSTSVSHLQSLQGTSPSEAASSRRVRMLQPSPTWDIWSYGRAAAATGCAAVALYAAFAERRVIRRAAGNMTSQLKGRVMDLLASGFSFNPNPVGHRSFGR